MRKSLLWSIGLVLLALAVVIAIGLPGTGADRPHRVFVPAGEPEPTGVPLPPTDQEAMPFDPATWEDPIGYEAVEVKSESEGDLPFVPDVPDGLGEPTRIVVSAFADEPITRRIAWIYEDSELGTIILEEDIAFETQADLEEPATNEPGCTVIWNEDFTGYEVDCHGAGFSLIALDTGTNALAIDGNAVSALQWIESLDTTDPDVLKGQPEHAVLELQLFVEKDGLSPEELASIANSV